MTFPAMPATPIDYSAPAPKRTRAWDVVLGWTLFTLAVLLGGFTAYLTFFFVMMADSCGSRTCKDGYIESGMLLSWGATIFALAAAAAMMVVSTVKGWLMFYWPLLAAGIIIAGFVGGAVLAEHAVQA